MTPAEMPAGGERRLSVLDLFSGIGGFSLGLERAGGFRTDAFCEPDPFCRRVLERRWPGVPIFHSVKGLRHDRLNAADIAPDVIVGGFPCQDLSIAGQQAGLGGPQSGLWWEFSRVVGELSPGWVIAENVGHTWRRWVPAVRRSLAGRGYSSLPIRVRASDLGAPHERARVYVVANADRERLRELSRWWGGPCRQVASELARSWDSAPRGLGADDGVPDRVDRLRTLGNSLIPHIPHLIGLGIIATRAAALTACPP